MKKIYLKIIVCLLTVMTIGMSLCVSSVSASANKADNLTVSETAAVLRLKKYTGTISIENSTGNNVRIKKNSKLYNGYTINTEEKSYAWITLDKKGVLKLSECTSVTVRRNKKKLEILLNEGEMFFNVNKKLTGTESLDIKTSNMTTGVRGTMGYVAASDVKEYEFDDDSGMSVKTLSKTTEVTILEGQVEVKGIDSASGASANESVKTLQLSQANSCIITDNYGSADSEDSEGILFAMTIGEEDITELVSTKGFIAVDVAEDEDIRQRLMDADVGFTEEIMEEVVNNAENILAENEQAKQEEIAANEQLLSEQLAVQQEKVAEQSVFFKDIQYVFGKTTGDNNPVYESDEETNTTKTTSENKPITAKVYTVNFKDQDGNKFGYQKVTSGGYATQPQLKPTASGYWRLAGENTSFMFTSTPVVSDITLEWKSFV